jgi:hypothetical protein
MEELPSYEQETCETLNHVDETLGNLFNELHEVNENLKKLIDAVRASARSRS